MSSSERIDASQPNKGDIVMYENPPDDTGFTFGKVVRLIGSCIIWVKPLNRNYVNEIERSKARVLISGQRNKKSK